MPSTNSVVNRNTTDYSLSFGLNPTVHLGTNVLTFNSGVQGTIRRDSESPVQMNQNLFRVFTYVSTSSFFNLLAVSAYLIREAGPFTESNLSSRSLTGAVDFRVGEPWGKTALVTGWGDTNQTFSPDGFKNHYTSSYVASNAGFRSAERESDRRRPAGMADRRTKLRNRPGPPPRGQRGLRPSRNWDLQASGLTPAPGVSTSTTRHKMVFPSPTQDPSTASSTTKVEKSRCSIRFASRADCRKRLSSISRVGTINSSDRM